MEKYIDINILSKRQEKTKAGFSRLFGTGPDNLNYDRILVVDDEPAIREVIKEYLSGVGYRVETAADGLEALTILGSREFDLVITDLSMPRLDGFGLMKQAHEIQPLATIIVLSGQGTFSNAIEAVHRGAYDFVAKPVRDFNTLRLADRKIVG